MSRITRFAIPALAAAAVTTTASAGSFTYNVTNITANSQTNAAAGESQLSVTVDDVMQGFACFTFNNVGPAAMSITSIYFEDLGGSVSGDPVFTQGPGVSYEKNTKNNLNLPGGNQPSVDFNEAFGVEPTSGMQPKLVQQGPPMNPGNNGNGGGFSQNGVGVNELLKVCYALTGSFQDVLNALNNGDRIGFHVQSFADGGSEAFVTGGSTPPTHGVPTPSAVGLGLGLMGLLATRRRRSEIDAD